MARARPPAAAARPVPAGAWRRALRHLLCGLLLGPALATATRPLDDPTLLALEYAARAQPLATATQLARQAQGWPETDERRLFALALRGELLASRDDLAGAQATLAPLQAQAERSPVAAAAAQWVQSAMAQRSGARQRAARLLGEALATLGPDGPPLLRLHLTDNLAHLQAESGALDDAVRLRQQAITLADALGPDWRRSEARNGLAYALVQAQQPERAAALNAESLALARRSGEKLALSRALTTASFVRGQAGDVPGETEALQGAITAARQAGATELEVLGLANLADNYLQHGDYPTALRLAQQALPLARGLADLNSESVALSNIGLALISMHRLAEGQQALREATAIEERANALTNLMTLADEQGRYLERAGYLHEAYAAFRQHRALADKVFRRDHQQAIVELQESFDHQRRARDLALLHTDNQLKQAELTNQQLRQRLWAAAVAGGLLLLCVTILLLRRLRQTNRALAQDNALLRHQSEIDPLTGLANRHHLQRHLARRSGATGPGHFDGALLLIDLDHFKRINDRHGHAAGDAVLVAVAQRLRAVLRDDDLLVRWGGEEFLVVSTTADAAALDALAQRLLDAVAGTPVALTDSAGRQAPPGLAGAGALPVSVSIGYAAFPLAPSRLPLPWARAVDLVDTALYLAKSHGRNRACGLLHMPADSEDALLALSHRLEAAWRAGEVVLRMPTGPAAPDDAGPPRVQSRNAGSAWPTAAAAPAARAGAATAAAPSIADTDLGTEVLR